MKENEQRIGAIEAVKEGVKAIAPGLTFGQIFKDAGHELKANVAHGAHELAAALFNGSAFVMYPRGTREDQGQEKEMEAPKQERGGRSM